MKVSGVFLLIFSSNWSNLKYGNSVPRNRRFCGPAMILFNFLEYIFEILLEINACNKNLVKND